MAVKRGAVKENILREVYRANRDNEGKPPPAARPPVSARRNGMGLAGVMFVVLLAGMAWSLKPPSTGARDVGGSEAPAPASEPIVPYAVPDGGAPASAADYAGMVEQPLVSLAGLFGLEVGTIVIDPGHGGRDVGATGPNGLTEKTVTLDVARRLKARLESRPGLRVLLTRDEDRKRSLRDRVRMANAVNADLFVSLHLNWLPQQPANVIETYYFGPPEDEAAVALAAAENRDSSYALADFDEMVSRMGQTMKHQESLGVARHIQASLYNNVRERNQSVMNSGVKTAPFVVLLGADMPSVLAEMTCISNVEEARKLATAAYRDELASYLEQGIVSYLESRRPAPLIAKEANPSGANRYAVKEKSDQG